MNVTLKPRLLRGEINAIPSKSFAHRLLILAAFADKPTQLHCPDTNKDIESTVQCLRVLGATIQRTDSGYTVFPAESIPEAAQLFCGESGSTLRFMLPVAGALGVDAEFVLEGRLSKRPLSPLWEEMERMGCTIHWKSADRLYCTGKLQPGAYRIDGSVSSQFITGLILAFSLMNSGCSLEINGSLQSKPYLDITKETVSLFCGESEYPGRRNIHSPGYVAVEGDWSNAAFFLTAAALGSSVNVRGLNQDSVQGDRAVVTILTQLEQGEQTISSADIPDLVPILSVAAAAMHGAVFTDIQRLRLKESDRVSAIITMLRALGIHAEATEETLRVWPGPITGGTVDAVNDHRIAMAAAIAATVASRSVTILGAECVQKSYPNFWEDYANLGGQYEFNIR